MRGNTGKLRFRIYVDRGAVGMLHSPARALRCFAEVKNKKVMIERRSSHHLDFILANLAQSVFHVALFPLIAVDRHRDIGRLRAVRADPGWNRLSIHGRRHGGGAG